MKTVRETSQNVINELLDRVTLYDGYKVLEPSAGFGKLADGIKKSKPNIILDCVELNENNCDELRKKGHNVVGRDFFHFKSDTRYDAIIAAPNFRNNVDVKHIMKMYTHLDNNGVIVSLTSPNWMIENGEHQIKFRKWLEDKNYSITMLPDNSFIEDGLTVPTAIIVIEK